MTNPNSSLPFLDPNHNNATPTFFHNNRYDINNKIMVSAIMSLSLVVVLVVALHIYARYALRRHQRLQPIHLPMTRSPSTGTARTGLDPSLIAVLPISAFESNADEDCAVCLSALRKGDLIRRLPNCSHVFHVACIDKWLAEQPKCPVCRAEVKLSHQSTSIEPHQREGPSALPYFVASSSSSSSSCVGSEMASLDQPCGGKVSRLSSFRRILSRERSSTRVAQLSLGQDHDFVQDFERQ